MQDVFNPKSYPDLLVGLTGPDDAAIWRLSEDRALVVTTDFFTPVVDDAYDYGAIAATNSLSDIYAMGGQPFLALNIAALPDDLPIEISIDILRGGAEKAREAGVVIAGGHTVKDKEPKYGLVAIGFVDPCKMLIKGGLRAGNVLVLTKPIGFGVTTTALKQERVNDKDLHKVIDWMKRLNNTAARVALEYGLQGATDITGFGLLGHAMEMAQASSVGLQIDNRNVPLTNGARRYAEKGFFPGGAFDNMKYFGGNVKFSEAVDEPAQMLLYDPQTSGGLLLGVPPEKLDAFEERTQSLGQAMWVIGSVVAGAGIEVR
ncbi:MAG: selenide, water dikinase SelD [Anaerolineales bacterium]|nr:selenide, water dikinase SelD [Anaerolineales bacterium]